MTSTLTDTTLVVVGAGYAFGRRGRLWRYMCHKSCGFGFGSSNDEG